MSSNEDLPILAEVGQELRRRFVAAESGGSRFGRLRSRPWMRARVVLPLATLVVAGSAAAATISLTGGAKPLSGGGYFACPPGDTYMADHQNGVVYPWNYPTYKGTNLARPGWLKSIRCFGSLERAIAGGYTLAEIPAGYTALRGVYFTEPNAYVRATCGRARRVTRAPIFCPQEIPEPWEDVSNEPKYGGQGPDCPGKGCEQPILSINGTFVDPHWYTSDGSTDVSIWAISTEQESAPATIGLVGCPGAKLQHRTTFRGHSAGWYTCKDAETVDGANTVFQWSIGDEHYGVELDGSTKLDRQVTAYIVSHLVEIKPKA